MADEKETKTVITVDENAPQDVSDYRCPFSANDKEAVDLALHAQYRIENGSIKILGQVDNKSVMEKMLAEICLSYINQDKDFSAWRENNAKEISPAELQKYFLAKKIK